ncbi:MAG: cyclase family protein [Candidatus Methanomethyliaceae archaeon]
MFIELSYSLEPEKIVMPGNIEKPIIIKRSRMSPPPSDEKDTDVRWNSYNNTSIVKFFAHTGTHIDTPFHVDDIGFRLNDFELKDFIFEHPLFLEIPKTAYEKITVGELELYKDSLSNCDVLLIYTGFSSFRETNPQEYVEKQPSFTVEAAQYLADNFNIRAYGVDLIGIENIPQGKVASPVPFPVHKTLLLRKRKKVFLIEDMNLKPLVHKKIKRLYVIPLRIFGIEAMPVTAFAEVED